METWLFVVVVYLGWAGAPDPTLSFSVYKSKENCEIRKKQFETFAKGKPEYLFWNCVKRPYESKLHNDSRSDREDVLPQSGPDVQGEQMHGLEVEWPSLVQ
jgi:hypothetical protein